LQSKKVAVFYFFNQDCTRAVKAFLAQILTGRKDFLKKNLLSRK